MLHPGILLDAITAALGPNALPSGMLAAIPLDMTVVQMRQIIVAQLSLTEDFGLRGWVSLYPDGISLLAPAWPDYFALSRLTPRPLIVYVGGQTPPSDSILAPVPQGQYYLNILNLTNSLAMFGFMQSVLA